MVLVLEARAEGQPAFERACGWWGLWVALRSRRRRRRVLGAAAVASMLICSLSGCSEQGRVAAAAPQALPSPVEVARAPGVDQDQGVGTAVSGDALEILHVVETRLITENDVTVVARSSGVLQQVQVGRGDRVEAGQTLATFENEMQSLQFAAAQAEVARAEEEERRLKLMVADGLEPRQKYDIALRDRDVARAERDLAQHLLGRTKVVAPFAGVITERFAREGMYVMEIDVIPLFRLLGDGPLQARVYLPEWTAAYLVEGAGVQVLPEFGGGANLPGRVQWISPVVDPVAGTLEVRVRVERRPSVTVGSSVSLHFTLRSDPSRILLPRESLLLPDAAPGGSVTVMVAEPDGEWRPRIVRLGLVAGDRVEVLSGLDEGERFRISAVADDE